MGGGGGEGEYRRRLRPGQVLTGGDAGGRASCGAGHLARPVAGGR
jgi:hypothetical protein